MRISDWSSDVCSSDLRAGDFRGAELARGRIMCAMDGAEQLAQAGAVHGADAHGFGPGHERQLARQQGLDLAALVVAQARSEEHTSELQSLMRISYADFCLKKKKITKEVYDDKMLINNRTTHDREQITDLIMV